VALLNHDMEWRRTRSSINPLDWLSGPPNFLFGGYPGSFPGIKRPRCNCNLLPLSSTKVKNEWNYNSASPLRLHGVDRDVTFLVVRTCVFVKEL
jgi:hypothetical protein